MLSALPFSFTAPLALAALASVIPARKAAKADILAAIATT